MQELPARVPEEARAQLPRLQAQHPAHGAVADEHLHRVVDDEQPDGQRVQRCDVVLPLLPEGSQLVLAQAQPSPTRGLEATSVPSDRVLISKSAKAFGATRCSSRSMAIASSRISTSACSLARMATKCRMAR